MPGLNPQSASTTGTTITISSYAVPAGSNKILTVRVGSESAPGTGYATSVTFGGTNLTARAQVQNSIQSTEIWDLALGSATDTGDIVVTFSGSVGEAYAFAATQEDLAQQAPEASATNGAAISTSITTVTDNALVVEGASCNSYGTPGSTTTTGTGQTKTFGAEYTAGGTIAGLASYAIVSTAGSYSTGWSTNGTRPCAVSVAYEADTSGGGSSVPIFRRRRF